MLYDISCSGHPLLGPNEDSSTRVAPSIGGGALPLPQLQTGELPSSQILKYMEGINKRVTKLSDAGLLIPICKKPKPDSVEPGIQEVKTKYEDIDASLKTSTHTSLPGLTN